MNNNDFLPETSPSRDEVSKLILSTWQRPCWNYNCDLLEAHLGRPSQNTCISVAMKDTRSNELASYQAFIPFNIEYFGQRLKASFASFLTVSSKFHGQGLAGTQQAYLIDEAIKLNYDVYITMCEVDAASNWAVKKIFSKRGMEVHLICVLNYYASLSRFLEKLLPESLSSNTKLFTKDHIEKIIPLLAQFGQNADLKKVIAPEEVEFLFIERPLSKTYVYEKHGEVKGLINFMLIDVLEEEHRNTNLYFENIFLDKLSKDEKIDFLGSVFKSVEGKYNTAFLPKNGRQDMELFKYFKFREVPRKLNFYMVELRPNIVKGGVKPINDFFFDVY